MEDEKDGASSIGFEKTIRDLKIDGCKEEDIIGLLQQFVKNEQNLIYVFDLVAVTEADIKNTADANGKKDIGEGGNGNNTNTAPKKFLKMTDLSKLMVKIEDIVDTELGTLRNHILQNTSARKLHMSFQQFKEHVHNWAVEVWRDRMPED